MNGTRDELREEVARWRADPDYFCRGVLGVRTLWEKQRAILDALRDHERVSVAACHDSGKTFVASVAFWWWALAFQPCKIITTAPTGRQVRELLWNEIRARWIGLEGSLGPDHGVGKPMTTSWRMAEDEPDWFGLGFSTTADEAAEHATKFHGYHSPHILLIFDEAAGIPKAIWDAAEGLMTSGHVRWLAIGNPTDPAGPFGRAYRSRKWHSIRIDAHEHPNVAHGAGLPWGVTPTWVEHMRESYGETSPIYLSKVRGVFPPSGDDTLIPLGLVDAAFARPAVDWQAATKGQPHSEIPPAAIGVDVARFGTDLTTIYVVRRHQIEEAIRQGGQDTVWTAGKVAETAERYGITKGDAWRIAVDDTGVGGGVTDILRSQGWNIQPVNFGEKPVRNEDVTNRRTELWWGLREWIKTARLGNLDQITRERLLEDLTSPVYSFKTDQRIELEPKDRTKKRLGRSPDEGDGLALAVWADLTPVASSLVERARPREDRRARRDEIFEGFAPRP